MKVKVICDKCKKEFKLRKNDIKTQSFLGIDEEYYNCPRCKEKYVVVVTNIKTKILRKEIDVLRSYKNKNKEQYELIENKLKEYKKEMDRLNNR